jgi:hypothetical protein
MEDKQEPSVPRYVKDPTWVPPEWTPPKTLEETELRLANLAEEVLDIQTQLGEDTKQGMPRSTDWRHRANVAVRFKQSEIRFLKVFQHSFNQALQRQLNPPPAPETWEWYRRTLYRYRRVVQRLVKEGVDVGEDGLEVLALTPPPKNPEGADPEGA